jgi:hypothetical protein
VAIFGTVFEDGRAVGDQFELAEMSIHVAFAT